MCGQSSVCDNEHDYAEQFLSGSNLILRKHKRTENNVFLLLGDEYCVQNYNFVKVINYTCQKFIFYEFAYTINFV